MKACVIVAVVAAAVAAVAIASPQRQPVDVRVSDDPPFSSDELNTMSKFFLQNVNINNQGGRCQLSMGLLTTKYRCCC